MCLCVGAIFLEQASKNLLRRWRLTGDASTLYTLGICFKRRRQRSGGGRQPRCAAASSYLAPRHLRLRLHGGYSLRLWHR
jgi:hypothetical protein